MTVGIAPPIMAVDIVKLKWRLGRFFGREAGDADAGHDIAVGELVQHHPADVGDEQQHK